MFAGYNKHAAEWRVRQASVANALVKIGKPLWKILPQSRGHKLTNLFRQLDRFSSSAALSPKERYWRWASISTKEEIGEILTQKAKENIDAGLLDQEKEKILSGFKTGDFNEVLLTDMNLVLVGDMLVKADLMSMANSVEVRSPFLDRKVVDFAFGLPAEYKIDGKMKKKIVQDAFRSLLPDEIYNRPKQGFDVPLAEWFKNELSGFIFDDLLSEAFIKKQGIFNFASIQKIKQKLYSINPGDTVDRIWGLIVFQSWYKRYFLHAA